MKLHHCLLVTLLSIVLWNCQPSAPPVGDTLFTEITADYSGIDFANTLYEDTAFNILNYLYFFNGGGVAVGDVNQDSLPDIYLTANMGRDRLYLNRGNFQFEEVTLASGIVGTEGWSTGVNMGDANGDGLLDIYVCQVTEYLSFPKTHNLLFINQGTNAEGIPQFSEQAEQAGVAHRGFSTQSAFFDYDRDGDLDLYLLNHSVHTESTYGKANKLRFMHDLKAGDKLYRNDSKNGTLQFTEVTEQAGIYNSQIGYGLGLAIGDLNGDGWQDIYVGNDFHENDYLYLNNGDGTFSEQLTEAIGHTSRFSMGVDIADMNNDALPDVLSLDMKPDREDILKTSTPEDAYDIYQFKLSYGYHPQLARNALQLNQGTPQGSTTPLFSEIAEMSGIPATDWSWSVLGADFDLDGRQDLFISNGIFRRPNDMDYIKYISENDVKNALAKGVNEENLKVILKMPSIPIENYAYRQIPSPSYIPSFEKVSAAWGLNRKGFSNGAAWGDLDADGDLDLVINNLNATASLYRNEAVQKELGNWLKVQLHGVEGNPSGVGARIVAYAGGSTFYRENQPTRGFQSSVEANVALGLGTTTQLDSLVVQWPNGDMQTLKALNSNQTIHLYQKNAQSTSTLTQPSPAYPFEFSEVPSALPYRHQEDAFLDFTRQQLIPHLQATRGPCIAVGDLNGDGLDDFYVGGATHQAGAFFVQTAAGGFRPFPSPALAADSTFEDTDAVFFDVDGDQDVDLFVASGGSRYPANPNDYLDRLYLNDGRGNFTKATAQLPRIPMNTSCVAAADWDADGDLDLFVGGLSIPGRYGYPAKSALYLNDGRGNFSEQTPQLAPALQQIGMVTDAAWLDLNQDNRPDLVVAGEWMPLTIFLNEGTSWQARSVAESEGLWQHLQVFDANNDGNLDLLAGNMGLNSELRGTPEEPLQLYVNDFDGNSLQEQIISLYRNTGQGTRQAFPLVGRDALTMQMPVLKKRFFQYSELAEKTVEDLFPQKAQDAVKSRVVESNSLLWLNQGDGTLKPQKLPAEAQIAPIFGSLVYDFDSDGNLDVAIGGNLHGVAPAIGRYDACYGQLLLGNGDGTFVALPNRAINFWLKGEIRHLKLLPLANGKLLVLAARNNEALQLLYLDKKMQ